MSIRMEDALKLLEENNGSHVINCYVPSLQRDVSFKPLTVGRIKTISKILLETSEDINDMYIPLTSVLVDSCLEPLDLNSINEIDRMKILLTLKIGNNISEDIFDVVCPSCETDFTIKIDYENSLKKLSNVPKTFDNEFTIGDVKYYIEYNIPSIELTLKFREYGKQLRNTLLANSGEDITQEQKDKIDFHVLKMYDSLFIKNIKINDDEIEGFNKMPMGDRLKLIDKLPFEVITYLSNELINKNVFYVPSPVEEKIVCPKCKAERTLEMGVNDFFLS